MPKRILWIENQLRYSQPHLDTLRRAGYVLDVAWSAEEGRQILQQRGAEYDLILLDILMGTKPLAGRDVEAGRTGLVLHEIIRHDLGLRMPILFVTVILDDGDIARLRADDQVPGLETDVLHKPVAPSRLLHKVESLIGPADS